MKFHSLMILAVLSSAATAAAADYTIVSLDKKYSGQELAAICALENAAFYRSLEGRYGCTNGENNVECLEDGACTAFIQAPFAFAGPHAKEADAETVLRMPVQPAASDLAGSTASGEAAAQ